MAADQPGAGVLDWLATRRPAPPPALRERMAVAVRAVAGSTEPEPAAAATARAGAPAAVDPQDPASGGASVVGVLAEAAVDRLRQVLTAPGGRGAALDLLAADALLTYACEAAAERGPDALAALTRAYGPDRLTETLLPEST